MRTFSVFLTTLTFTAAAGAAPLPGPPPPGAPPPLADATATSSLPALHLPAVTETHLDNGLRVVLEESHGSPFVAMEITYDVGSRDEPPGKAGLAEVTERMAQRSTKHAPDGTYEATLEHIGALRWQWGTALDVTADAVTVPSNAVDSILWLWSDQMGFFAPDDAKALAEATAETTTDRENKETRVPLGAVPEIVEHALFPEGHPYHRMTMGPTEPGITAADVRAFHDAHFAPNRAVLVLAGDFDSARVLDHVRAYFAPIARARARDGATTLEPARLDGEVRLDVAADVKNAEVWVDWRTPPYFDGGDAELDIAARILASARLSLLRQDLVTAPLRVATRVTARQISHALGSDFRITATVERGQDPQAVLARIDRALDTLRTSGVDPIAFTLSKNTLTIPILHGLDETAQRASTYAQLAERGRDPAKVEGDVGRYDAATAASVRSAIAEWLGKGHRVVTVVTPDPKAPLAGELRGTKRTGGAR
jgi:zinc protease